MGQYLVTRAEGAPPNTTAVDALSGTVFFQLWQVRADPYRVLANGDTLWWVDQRTREVRWEMRVRNLRRRQCSSVEVAHEYLRRWFGLFPGDLSTYKADGVFRNGWLIAWQNEIVAPCDTVLLGDVRVRQSGFLPVDDVLAARLGLPTAGRPALRPLPDLGDADLLAEPQERAIPLAVRRAVFERDGSRCRSCSRSWPAARSPTRATASSRGRSRTPRCRRCPGRRRAPGARRDRWRCRCRAGRGGTTRSRGTR